MSGTHRATVRGLYLSGGSPIDRLAPEAKLVGLVAFVVVLALTPRRAVGVFALDAAVLAAAVAAARIPVRIVATRLLVVAPFVLFAFAIPFVAHSSPGDATVSVAGVDLPVDGLWATWNIVAKATLGATAAIVLTATTPVPSVLTAMARVHVPAVLVAIVSSMLRYLEVLADQLARMRRAMVARGHDPRWLWQVGPIASSVGLLFVRSYERGERVHLAMAARGSTGAPLVDDGPRARPTDWAAALAPSALALGALVVWLVAG